MAELVPGPGSAVNVMVAQNTGQVTRLGPFAAGTYVERLAVTVYLRTQSLITGLRLGFGMSSGAAETYENFQASSKLWRVYGAVGFGPLWSRIELGTGESVQFEVDVGVFVETGGRSVLVFHDLEDGTDVYLLFVTCKTLVVAKRLPVTA